MKEKYVENIVEFINELSPDGPHADLEEGSLLLESGMIDSWGIVELVMYIEEKYNFELTADDLVVETFGTIGSIAELIKRKSNGRTVK